MRSQNAVLLLATSFLSGTATGFVPLHGTESIVRHGDVGRSKHPTLLKAEPSPNNANNKFPLASIVLAVVGAQSAYNLLTELPSVLSSVAGIGNSVGTPPPDYFGTAIDVGFLGYATKTLADQVIGGETSSSSSLLAGLECSVTLNVGREPGTWMDKEWGSSGARLVLPNINLRFTNEQLDLGFPGEESLGGRFCNRLDVLQDTVRFVGPNGETEVPIDASSGGGWATLPISNGGAKGVSKLRFFLDFPEGASRNDVTLPAGRVFFSGVCLDDVSTALPGERVVQGPATSGGNAGILADGGMTIKKKDGITNLYGAFGEVNLMLGRYSVSETKKDEV